MNKKNNICKKLYKDYYNKNSGFSSQTSSFWEKYGKENIEDKNKNGL